jgi:hypothetical protein
MNARVPTLPTPTTLRAMSTMSKRSSRRRRSSCKVASRRGTARGRASASRLPYLWPGACRHPDARLPSRPSRPPPLRPSLHRAAPWRSAHHPQQGDRRVDRIPGEVSAAGAAADPCCFQAGRPRAWLAPTVATGYATGWERCAWSTVSAGPNRPSWCSRQIRRTVHGCVRGSWEIPTQKPPRWRPWSTSSLTRTLSAAYQPAVSKTSPGIDRFTVVGRCGQVRNRRFRCSGVCS